MIFRKDELDLSRPITFETFYQGQPGKKAPSMIVFGNGRMIRPFQFRGIYYLSVYEQNWKRNSAFLNDLSELEGEYMNVVLYRGGRENLGKDGWSSLNLDRVCRYRMDTIRLISEDVKWDAHVFPLQLSAST